MWWCGFSFLLVGLFIFQWIFSHQFIQKGAAFIFYAKVVLFLFIIYVLKYLFAGILVGIFNQGALLSEYTYSVSIYNHLQGLLFVPVMLLIYFSTFSFLSVVHYVVFPMIGLTLLLRLVRLFVIGASKNISYFYIFLYLCTLEILPLVVMIKIFV